VKVSRLVWLPKGGGKMNCGYRLHTHFEIFRGTVNNVTVTGSKPKGEADERAVIAITACLLIRIYTGRAFPRHFDFPTSNEA